jgi:hypothetical protein
MVRSHQIRYAIVAAAAMVLLMPSLGAAVPMDMAGGGAFRCRASATRLGDEITITFWLRTAHADRHWRIRIWDNDVLIYNKTKTTNAMGGIRVRAGTQNLPGRDVFRFRAANRPSGSVCSVRDLRV